jgi:hypothetical protein
METLSCRESLAEIQKLAHDFSEKENRSDRREGGGHRSSYRKANR